MASETKPCCPPFQREVWDEKEVTWRDKPFVKGRIRSFLHIPLNFAAVLARNMQLIEAAGAMPDEVLIISDENSLWGADLYLAVTKNVPHAQMAQLSGTFLTKVFEGPYREIPAWIKTMKSHVASKGKELKQLYFLYKTCPKCAKKSGKNYVVLLAKV
jgi:hypothetical protein